MDINELSIPAFTDPTRSAPKVHHPGLGLIVPDFEALFPLPEHAGDQEGADETELDLCGPEGDCPRCDLTVTPRIAYLLHLGASETVTKLRDVIRELDHAAIDRCDYLGDVLSTPVLKYLAALPEVEAAVWLERFVHTVEVLRARLSIGVVPEPRNTAEEIAAHFALRWAAGWETEVAAGTSDPMLAALPTAPVVREDLDRMLDLLFEDVEVLTLFSPGFGDIDAAVKRMRDWGVEVATLHPRDWFLPFRDTEPVTRFGPPFVDGPLSATLGQDAEPGDLAEAAEAWANGFAKLGATRLGAPIRIAESHWRVAVIDGPLLRDLTVELVRIGSSIWHVHGLLWPAIDDAVQQPVEVYDAEQLNNVWRPRPGHSLVPVTQWPL